MTKTHATMAAAPEEAGAPACPNPLTHKPTPKTMRARSSAAACTIPFTRMFSRKAVAERRHWQDVLVQVDLFGDPGVVVQTLHSCPERCRDLPIFPFLVGCVTGRLVESVLQGQWSEELNDLVPRIEALLPADTINQPVAGR